MKTQQGELLDQIETHVTEAVEHVEKGTEDLVKARDYMRSANKKKIMIACCILILIIVVIGPVVSNFT